MQSSEAHPPISADRLCMVDSMIDGVTLILVNLIIMIICAGRHLPVVGSQQLCVASAFDGGIISQIDTVKDVVLIGTVGIGKQKTVILSYIHIIPAFLPE